MANTITFTLSNNQNTDSPINVTVEDRNTNQQVGNYTLNRNETVPVQIVGDSWGKGKAAWVFWTGDRSISSEKQEDDIVDGDVCTLS